MLPTAEALYPQKPQAPRSKGLLEDLYEEVAKEYFYFLAKTFGSLKKCRTFARSKQEQHLFKVAKYYYKPISVKVSYSRNAIHQKRKLLFRQRPLTDFFILYTMSKQVETTETMLPTAEALYPKKPQAPRSKGLLEDLYEEVAKEYFQEILQEARGECVIKVGSKKNSYTGKITDEWRICALHQEGKGKTFATAVLSLYGAITYAKVKEGGVL